MNDARPRSPAERPSIDHDAARIAGASPTPPAQRWLKNLVLLALLFATACWSWQQPFLASFRTGWELSRTPPAQALDVPVEGIAARRIADTFGAPRGRDRSHQGVDIFAKRGTPVTSATRGVVVSIRDAGLGGRQVWVLGPARERYYYAHLDDWVPGLKTGGVVAVGQRLGSVGTTGNARGTPPHLHFGIYGAGGARDPLPLLRAGVVAGGATR